MRPGEVPVPVDGRGRRGRTGGGIKGWCRARSRDNCLGLCDDRGGRGGRDDRDIIDVIDGLHILVSVHFFFKFSSSRFVQSRSSTD